ncbi:MAG: HlyD family efflux transporter periplasmic adaptor subunit [Bacillota bacterium]|nr:HlyD family efflux transporter periplasmic adaptor subunit [Bacillota bacterium]
MNENTSSKRREWVKNAAIIFLIIMLLLTFFSNTIMNYSLPEVATQYVQSGTITAKVRGTGNVEATDPYNVVAKESRVIASVAVKQGDVVEKDQVLYYLEDAESDELQKAEDELEDLKLAYMKGLFGNNVSSEVISKVANGNTDGFATLQAKVTDMQNRLDAAQDRVKECQDTLDAISLQSTINNNNSSVSTAADELAKIKATTDLTHATEGFNRYKAERVAELTSEITELEKQIADLEVVIGSGEGAMGDQTSADTTDTLQIKKQETKDKLDKALITLNEKISQSYTLSEALVFSQNADWNKLSNDQQLALQDFNAAYTDYKQYSDSLNDVSSVGNNQDELKRKKERLSSLQAKLAEINAITVESSEGVQDATARLEKAEQNINEITSAGKQSSVAYQNQIANAEAALKNAQAVYDLLKEEQTLMVSDINAELDLAKASKDIADKEEEIAKLKEKSMGAAITAPVAGTVTSLAYVAGETTKPEEPAAVIQAEGKGFTLSISVTNEQAQKVQVGDVAELQNAWYYDDAQVILSAIKPDPDAPGQKKLLVFDVTGSSIQAGQALNISVGQRSAEYELVVPNSAVREDNNGKFILIVESKSTPLGNRYIATRVDVEVLASDDNNTAISAPLYGYEYVITTSTKPVEAKKQVRLNE